MKYKKDDYQIPAAARIGHVHLKVSSIERALGFYCGLLGFKITTTYGNDAAFIAAGDYHHHIGLNIWFSKNALPPPKNRTGLFHTAILYPSRKDLAIAVRRLRNSDYPFGASDHGVSEAIYLNDPDENGVELYWDRPREQWPRKSDGSVEMYTRPLNLRDLLGELKNEPPV